jgi:capsular polysaccharide biosynthesis protein
MDVREAVTIMKRRWWLIVGVPVLVAVISLLMSGQDDVTVEARLRFAIDIPRSMVVEGSDEGTAAKVGAALIDDIARVIPSEAFAVAVAQRLPDGVDVSAGEIASELSATDRHRIADVWVRRTVAAESLSSPDTDPRESLALVAEKVVEELEQNGAAWFARLGEDDISLTVIDGPVVSVAAPSLRARLDLPMRLALALVVGIGLAFLLHALDRRLYTGADAATASNAAVVGRIPRTGRGWRGP